MLRELAHVQAAVLGLAAHAEGTAGWQAAVSQLQEAVDALGEVASGAGEERGEVAA